MLKFYFLYISSNISYNTVHFLVSNHCKEVPTDAAAANVQSVTKSVVDFKLKPYIYELYLVYKYTFS